MQTFSLKRKVIIEEIISKVVALFNKLFYEEESDCNDEKIVTVLKIR